MGNDPTGRLLVMHDVSLSSSPWSGCSVDMIQGFGWSTQNRRRRYGFMLMYDAENQTICHPWSWRVAIAILWRYISGAKSTIDLHKGHVFSAAHRKGRLHCWKRYLPDVVQGPWILERWYQNTSSSPARRTWNDPSLYVVSLPFWLSLSCHVTNYLWRPHELLFEKHG